MHTIEKTVSFYANQLTWDHTEKQSPVNLIAAGKRNVERLLSIKEDRALSQKQICHSIQAGTFKII